MNADPPELARRTLALAGTDPVQVTVTAISTATRCFTATGRDDPVVTEALEVHVLVLRGGHPGTAVTRGTGESELLAALEQAASAAASAATAGAPGPHPGLPAPRPIRAHAGYDPATARHEAGAAETAIATVVAAAPGLAVEGTWTTRAAETAIASTAGVELRDRVTRAVLDVTLRDPHTDGTGAACAAAARAGELDAADVVARALLLLLPGEPTGVEAGTVPVVLGPEAVAAVLTVLARTAFDGLAHAEGRGTLAGRLGTRVAASAINLADAPRFARTLPAAFDLDGVPKAPVPLIQDGVAHRVVHDVRSAARAGGAAASTGHATAPGGAGDGPRPEHLVLSGGGAADVAELCAPVARGLYVSRLWYDSAIAPDGLVATARGSLRIERGRPAGPVAGVRLAADPLAVLRGTEALTRAQWLVPQGARASVVTPGLRTTGLMALEPA